MHLVELDEQDNFICFGTAAADRRAAGAVRLSIFFISYILIQTLLSKFFAVKRRYFAGKGKIYSFLVSYIIIYSLKPLAASHKPIF